MGSGQDQREQLWQAVDHIVDVFDRVNGAQSHTVIFAIE